MGERIESDEKPINPEISSTSFSNKKISFLLGRPGQRDTSIMINKIRADFLSRAVPHSVAAGTACPG